MLKPGDWRTSDSWTAAGCHIPQFAVNFFFRAGDLAEPGAYIRRNLELIITVAAGCAVREHHTAGRLGTMEKSP